MRQHIDGIIFIGGTVKAVKTLCSSYNQYNIKEAQKMRKTIYSLTALCAMAIALSCAGCAQADTIYIKSYQELLDAVASANADSSGAGTEIVLTEDLEVTKEGIPGLKENTDAVTGATIAVKTGNLTVNGNGRKIKANGYPTFNIEGGSSEDDSDALRDIVIKDLTIDGAGYQAKPGGGMFFENRSYVALENCRFQNCTAARTGGGALYAGPHHSSVGPVVKISDCSFSGNRTEGGSGAAILAQYAQIDITNTEFTGNEALVGGAIALYGDGTKLTVDSASRFTNNRAANTGGAVAVRYGSNGGRSYSSTERVTCSIDAAFSGNYAAAGENDVSFAVYYHPSFTGKLSIVGDASSYTKELKESRPIVGGKAIEPVFFEDIDRLTPLVPEKIHRAASYQDLKEILGYCKYDPAGGGWEKDDSGHARVTAGRARDGDLVVITADLKAETDAANTSRTPRTDAVTGATLYVTKDKLKIFGNGHTINGDGFPIFDIDGGEGALSLESGNLTIMEGAYNAKLGGAIFVEGDATLNAFNMTFKNCAARGGKSEEPAGGGGAVYLDPHGKGKPALNATGCLFEENKAANGVGGAVSAINGSVTLSDCTFKANKAAQGGAVGMKGEGELTLNGCNFSSNSSRYAGGAIDIHYGRSWYKKSDALNKDSRITARISRCSFSGNSAGLGEAADIAYSRYHDDIFPDDDTPYDSYLTADDDSLIKDLTFADIYRTKLKETETARGSGSGCSTGRFSPLIFALLGTTVLIPGIKTRR